jgi:hypothetical protein
MCPFLRYRSGSEEAHTGLYLYVQYFEFIL